MILIVASNKDTASLNIRNQILKTFDFTLERKEFEGYPCYTMNSNGRKVHLITLSGESVHAQNLPSSYQNVELIIFISRHSSLSGTPTLSVHTPGNLNKAELGGIAQTVSISPAHAMKVALSTLMKIKAEKDLGYEVSYEGTHHGPSLDVPTMFVELGSSVDQWNDLEAAETVARATVEAASRFGLSTAGETSVGIGGPHYNAKFTRIALEKEVSFSHMIPKYAIPDLTTDVLRQCVRKTLERVDYVTLDWKGIKGEDKPKIIRMVDELGLSYVKV